MLINDVVFEEFFNNSAYIYESEACLFDSLECVLGSHDAKDFPCEKLLLDMEQSLKRFKWICN